VSERRERAPSGSPSGQAVHGSVPRPVPDASPHSAPFWAAARQHRLVLQRCQACGAVQHYPRPWCTTCLSEDLGWIDSPGRGTVYSYTVIRRTAHPAFAPLVPYVYALVDLDEGPRMTTNVVGCPVDEVAIGMRVRPRFEDVDGAGTLVLFEPDR
jgi:uncharacterized OB-fold protein